MNYLQLTEHIKLFQHPPDLIVLSDTYLDEHTNPNSYPLSGYKHAHNTDVSIYYNPNLHASILDMSVTRAKDDTTPVAAHIVLQLYKNKSKTQPEYYDNMQLC